MALGGEALDFLLGCIFSFFIALPVFMCAESVLQLFCLLGYIQSRYAPLAALRYPPIFPFPFLSSFWLAGRLDSGLSGVVEFSQDLGLVRVGTCNIDRFCRGQRVIGFASFCLHCEIYICMLLTHWLKSYPEHGIVLNRHDNFTNAFINVQNPKHTQNKR